MESVSVAGLYFLLLARKILKAKSDGIIVYSIFSASMGCSKKRPKKGQRKARKASQMS
jgi:hypothetical protein